MLKVTYRLKLGQDEFELQAEVKDEKEFFETLSFYSNLPKTAPGGATDLKLVFRTTSKGHKYYSLISEQEQMEFKLGQNLEANGGGLFPKGWEKAYSADNEEGEQQNQSPAPLVGVQSKSAPAASKPAAAKPAVTVPLVNTAPKIQPAVPQAAAPIIQAPAETTAPAAANPNVNAVANNVLARFGIKK